MGNILKGALGGASKGGASAAGGGNDLLGGLLGMAMKQFGQSQQSQGRESSVPQGHFQPDFTQTLQKEPRMERQQANNQATILIRAMISAAKSDGKVDKQEVENVMKRLGEVTQAEVDFVRNEIARPLDVNELIRSVPRGLEENVYAISLIAINLDTNPEARYLHELAQGLGISPELSNQIHAKLGAPKIYS